METYKITYSCGHVNIVGLGGDKSEHAAKIRELEQGLCYDCEIDAMAAKDLETLRSFGAPELDEDHRFSECTFEHANALRAELLDDTSKHHHFTAFFSPCEIAEAIPSGANIKFADTKKAGRNLRNYVLNNYTDAIWWIDARNDDKMQREALAEWAKTLC